MRMMILAHPVYFALGAYMLFSNMVSAMPKPTDKSGAGYVFIYKFAHGVASNVLYALKSKFPQAIQGDAPAEKGTGAGA